MEHTNIPRDRATINAWLRSTELNYPIIHNTVNFHVANLANSICITPDNKKLDSQTKLVQRALPYVVHDLVLLGECFPMLCIKDNICQSIDIKDPDYMVVKRSAYGVSLISERPSENLRRIVRADDVLNLDNHCDDDGVSIDPKIIECIKRGENIPIDPKYIGHLKLLSAPRELRGTSYLSPIINELNNDKPLDTTEIKHTILYPFDNPELAIIKMTRLFYDRLWDQIEPWIEHCFSLVSVLNEWYTFVNGEKKPLLPTISFYNPSLS